MIRVLIVDDSPLVRKMLGRQLDAEPDIEVVGLAADPYEARDMLHELNPDVMTLDIQMPRMDGLTFLEKVMKHAPMPVLIVSSLATERSDSALRALQLGAVNAIAKPGSSHGVPGQLAREIRAAAQVRRFNVGAPPPPRNVAAVGPMGRHRIIALGASTGGTQALDYIMRELPADTPGTVIAQHMPAAFTKAFADRLNSISAMEVREAHDGDSLSQGLALLAPGDKHMVLRREGLRFRVGVIDGPLVHYQRPAVDVLFESVAVAAGGQAIGALLTGMGSDGAAGLLRMRQAGAPTLAEDESTCVVYGMPKEAVAIRAACEVVPLPRVASRLIELTLATAVRR